MDPSPAPPAPWLPKDGDKWELRHDDDGFTYKILKRLRLSDTPAPPPSSTADPEAREKNRRECKRNTLLKLRKRYQEEIR
ncbi:hypothetical protein Tsubulata_004769 [Turnera subulata]|uniref:Uncharacterized protein n=1 Tax=Turnera subulata TaxID=218843 RepID=A0A9Q0J2U4_9ROSI|nr:hypothetical protein Tsubulata_004769 [Turnera subulata]